MERLQRVKQTRSAKKGNITKAQDEIRELMLDLSNVELVNSKIQELKAIFEEFENAHADYHDQLKYECDIGNSNDYCEAVKKSMAEILGDVTSWITASANFQAVHDVLSFPLLTSIAAGDNVTPEDSISNIDFRPGTKSPRNPKSVTSKASQSTTVSFAKARAAARRAVLEAEAAGLERLQAIQREELTLQLRKRTPEL